MASGQVAPISTSKGPGTGKGFMFTYPGTEIEMAVWTYTNAKAGAVGLAKVIAEASQQAITARGSFCIALSGGSLLNALPALFQLDSPPDFSKWHVFYADERVVPHEDSDSNHGAACKALLNQANIPESQVHAIQEGLSADLAARAYEGTILNCTACPKTSAGTPQLDLILLGVGPDGHVASLFPNSAATAEKKRLVVDVTNSPKPPPERITMTLPLINAAREVCVVAMGAGKAEVVQRVLEVQSLPGALPAQLVRPESGALRWVLDLEAAAEINPELWDSARAYPRSDIPKQK